MSGMWDQREQRRVDPVMQDRLAARRRELESLGVTDLDDSVLGPMPEKNYQWIIEFAKQKPNWFLRNIFGPLNHIIYGDPKEELQDPARTPGDPPRSDIPIDQSPIGSTTGPSENGEDLTGLTALPTYFDANSPPLPPDGTLLGPESDDPGHPQSIAQLLGPFDIQWGESEEATA
jgi:hypothetical protein